MKQKKSCYSTLDTWIGFEQDLPLASAKIVALEKEEQWHMRYDCPTIAPYN
jgi:hypothetical protein